MASSLPSLHHQDRRLRVPPDDLDRRPNTCIPESDRADGPHDETDEWSGWTAADDAVKVQATNEETKTDPCQSRQNSAAANMKDRVESIVAVSTLQPALAVQRTSSTPMFSIPALARACGIHCSKSISRHSIAFKAQIPQIKTWRNGTLCCSIANSKASRLRSRDDVKSIQLYCMFRL